MSGKRKCVFTNKESVGKIRVLPRNILDTEEFHNWTNNVPVSVAYREYKGDSVTEIEMEANEVFHLLELSRLRVQFFEDKLLKIQETIKEQDKSLQKEDIDYEERRKEREIKESYKRHDVDQSIKKTETLVDDFFENKKNMWSK